MKYIDFTFGPKIVICVNYGKAFDDDLLDVVKLSWKPKLMWLEWFEEVCGEVLWFRE